jgi:hypothetical protein
MFFIVKLLEERKYHLLTSLADTEVTELEMGKMRLCFTALDLRRVQTAHPKEATLFFP